MPLTRRRPSALHTITRNLSAVFCPMTWACAGGIAFCAGPTTNSMTREPPTYDAIEMRWRYVALIPHQ
ncbi:MAG: hypothetical protein M5T61_02390 [Acidimicrobiia bacterium]|nr:hypothetical protein [Acidimicrobiia bacterium]